MATSPYKHPLFQKRPAASCTFSYRSGAVKLLLHVQYQQRNVWITEDIVGILLFVQLNLMFL